MWLFKTAQAWLPYDPVLQWDFYSPIKLFVDCLIVVAVSTVGLSVRPFDSVAVDINTSVVVVAAAVVAVVRVVVGCVSCGVGASALADAIAVNVDVSIIFPLSLNGGNNAAPFCWHGPFRGGDFSGTKTKVYDAGSGRLLDRIRGISL